MSATTVTVWRVSEWAPIILLLKDSNIWRFNGISRVCCFRCSLVVYTLFTSSWKLLILYGCVIFPAFDIKYWKFLGRKLYTNQKWFLSQGTLSKRLRAWLLDYFHPIPKRNFSHLSFFIWPPKKSQLPQSDHFKNYSQKSKQFCFSHFESETHLMQLTITIILRSCI